MKLENGDKEGAEDMQQVLELDPKQTADISEIQPMKVEEKTKTGIQKYKSFGL